MNPQPVTITAETNSEPQSLARFQLRGGWLTLARVIWLLLSLSAVSLLIMALVWNTRAWWNEDIYACDNLACYANDRAHLDVFGNFHLVAIYYGVGAAVETLPWALVGALIFWRKSHDPFALLFSLEMVLLGAFGVDWIVTAVISKPAPTLSMLISVLNILMAILFVLWYRFPDGRFAHRNMRWFAILWIALNIFAFLVPDDSLLNFQAWRPPLPQLVWMALYASIGFSLVYRYRRIAGAVERQQIRWVVFTGAIFACVFAPNSFIRGWLFNEPLQVVLLNISYLLLMYISSAVFAIGIGISILRYRLWDIDIIINRTLVYGGLTAIVIGIYVLIVGGLGTAIQGSGNLLVSVLATGLVAVLVQPLRDRLQRGVNRMMYGERDDPITVLSQLGQRLEGTLAPDAVLPSLVETVAQTLKLPYVAIETLSDNRLDSPTNDSSSISISSPIIAFGNPQSDVIRFPLIYQSETIGQLTIAPRAPGEALSPMDRHLLGNIAHQAGMAIHAVSLTADLQRSRQHLVTAREEERRRLRRDLHDGLGPNLASQGLKLAAVKQLLEKDPVSAIPLLDQVMAQNKSTVEDVRRLVYGLRPPALDELGLIAAIRDHVSGMDNNSSLPIEITEPSEGLPPLSAAVEVAAYRIVLEALTNVIRHAKAKHCAIRFSLAQNRSFALLQIDILDDGIGLPSDLRAGVGLRSMRERAEELGGKLTVESQPNGTHVLVHVPVGEIGAQVNLTSQAELGDSPIGE